MVDLEFTAPLYHFTSEAGFLGIVASKKLWLCNITKSNDDRELLIGPEVFYDAMSEAFSRDFSTETAKLLTCSARAKINSLYAGHDTFYATCFTPNRENEKMWKEYAANDTGVSIGFRAKAMNQLSADDGGRMTKISYLNEKNEYQGRQIVDEVIDRFSAKIVASGTQHPIALFQLAARLACLIIISVKTVKWSYEDEIRFSYIQFSDPRRPDAPSFLNPGKMQKRVPKKIIEITGKDYVEKPFGVYKSGSYDPSGAIESVQLGRECRLSEAEVSTLMSKNGFRNFSVSRR
ncbi:hypothetical protein DI396_03720 [Litorivita pollutaquae]|uniref:DUF2971 domain-containing protein n=1 Tax=Litorivita pollutaquae TaxID=2200892 RepID=A0A2V4NFH7_9RHOB|nr:DUF2971 domain-containing protein [Litorivita pollutaquae]PYC49163.1 hypothetical protein DI396_03720 [Litorivita pollutaquae]